MLENVPAHSVITGISIRNVNNVMLLGLLLLVLSNERALNELFVKSVEICDYNWPVRVLIAFLHEAV